MFTGNTSQQQQPATVTRPKMCERRKREGERERAKEMFLSARQSSVLWLIFCSRNVRYTRSTIACDVQTTSGSMSYWRMHSSPSLSPPLVPCFSITLHVSRFCHVWLRSDEHISLSRLQFFSSVFVFAFGAVCIVRRLSNACNVLIRIQNSFDAVLIFIAISADKRLRFHLNFSVYKLCQLSLSLSLSSSSHVLWCGFHAGKLVPRASPGYRRRREWDDK